MISDTATWASADGWHWGGFSNNLLDRLFPLLPDEVRTAYSVSEDTGRTIFLVRKDDGVFLTLHPDATPIAEVSEILDEVVRVNLAGSGLRYVDLRCRKPETSPAPELTRRQRVEEKRRKLRKFEARIRGGHRGRR